MKPIIKILLTYTLLGPPIGAVVACLAFVISEAISFAVNSPKFSQFHNLSELPLEIFKLLYLALIFSFPLGLVPALFSGSIHSLLQYRFHAQRAAIVYSVTATGLVSTIAYRALLAQVFLSPIDSGWESMEQVFALLLPPIAAAFALSVYFTRRAHIAS